MRDEDEVDPSIVEALRETERDVLELEKQSGEHIMGIRAHVIPSKGEITIRDVMLPVEDGDVLTRRLPNGFTERYTILDTGYTPAIRSFPAKFQMKVRKDTSVKNEQYPSVVHNYNMHGPNSRVNVSSTDNSHNSVSTSSESVFADMRQVILARVENETERARLLQNVEEMEATQKTPGFLAKYTGFMQNAANHMTVLAPLLPALAQILQHQ